MEIGSLNGRKSVVAILDSEVIEQHIVPNVARMGQGGKGEDGKGRCKKKTSQAKGKLMMAKERAKVASGKHARHSKGIAITVGNGVTWKRIVSRWQKSRPRVVEAKVLAISMNPRPMDQNTRLLADLVCARLGTKVTTGSGTLIAK